MSEKRSVLVPVALLAGVMGNAALAEEVQEKPDPATFVERTWKVPPDLLLVWQKRQFEKGTEKWAPNLSFAYDYDPFWMFVGSGGIDASIEGASGSFSPSKGELRMRYPKEIIEKMDRVVESLRPFEMFSIDRELFHRVPFEPSAFEKAVRDNERKLREIVLPAIDFDGMTLNEAVSVLEKRTGELDGKARGESRRGIKFTLVPRAGGGKVKDEEAGLDSLNYRTGEIKDLKLRDVPLETVLQLLCGRTLLRYRVDEKGVSLVHRSWSDQLPPVVFERQWRVAPEVIALLRNAERWAESWKDPDPFGSDEAEDREKEGAKMRDKLKTCSAKELLELYDVSFPRGSMVAYDAGKEVLTVKSSDATLEVVDKGLERVAIVLSRGKAVGR